MAVTDRDVEHRIPEGHISVGDETALAELDEHQKVVVQLDKIKELSVGPNVMRLPVSEVITTEENPLVKVILDHPLEGEISLGFRKPKIWDPKNELVEFLSWYGHSPKRLYVMQTERVYVKHSDQYGWEPIRPPSMRRGRHAVTDRWARWKPSASSLRNSVEMMFTAPIGYVALGGIVGGLTQSVQPGFSPVGAGMLAGLGAALVWLIMMAFLVDPERI